MAIRFRGSSDLRLDDKCRLSIPAAFRQVLADEKVKALVLVKGLNHKRIEAWPEPVWEEFENKIMALPSTSPLREHAETHYEVMQVVVPDGHGRIVLPADLRSYAGLVANAEVKVTGASNKIRIWDKDVWQASQDETNERKADWTAQLAELGV